MNDCDVCGASAVGTKSFSSKETRSYYCDRCAAEGAEPSWILLVVMHLFGGPEKVPDGLRANTYLGGSYVAWDALVKTYVPQQQDFA